MTLNVANCHCGALSLRCTGEPQKISMCHCLDCQRRTGSAFSVAVFFNREHVSIEKGSSASFARNSASGFPVAFHFCPQCGSNVYWEPARLPHLIGVAVGAFANPSLPTPVQSVWTKDKHTWLTLPPEIICFDANRT